jgi:hypothetical protein
MVQVPIRLHRRVAPAISRPLCAIVALVAGLSCAAHGLAATLNSTTYDLRLLGHVKNPAGTVLSTEGYTASPVFNATSTNLLNTTVPSPIPPLLAPNVLRVDESEAGDTAIIWIRGPLTSANDTFANMLDPNFDVELDLTLRFSELGPLEKVAITDVRPENGTHGFYNEVSYTTSGLGTAASPLLLAIRLDPADIQGTFSTSHVKVHFDFMEMVIPEPATWLLLSAAFVGVTMFRRPVGVK